MAMNSTALSNKPGSKKRPRDILIPVLDAQHFHHDDLREMYRTFSGNDDIHIFRVKTKDS